MSSLAHRRVLLKLSGEALMGDEDYGIDPKVLHRIAAEVMEAHAAGATVGDGSYLPRLARAQKIADLADSYGLWNA